MLLPERMLLVKMHPSGAVSPAPGLDSPCTAARTCSSFVPASPPAGRILRCWDRGHRTETASTGPSQSFTHPSWDAALKQPCSLLPLSFFFCCFYFILFLFPQGIPKGKNLPNRYQLLSSHHSYTNFDFRPHLSILMHVQSQRIP